MLLSPALRLGAAGRLLVLLAPLLLGGCLGVHPSVSASAGAPAFRPDAFFDGTSEGFGTLTFRGGRAHLLRVQSTGAFDADSTFRLDQTIRRGDERPSHRSWTMRRIAPGQYTGTLTDASGPVSVEVTGSTLRIRYPMGSGLRMNQRLLLQPDGRTAINLSTVTWHGIPIARVFETIHRPNALPATRRQAHL